MLDVGSRAGVKNLNRFVVRRNLVGNDDDNRFLPHAVGGAFDASEGRDEAVGRRREFSHGLSGVGILGMERIHDGRQKSRCHVKKKQTSCFLSDIQLEVGHGSAEGAASQFSKNELLL